MEQQQSAAHPTPEHIMKIGTGFMASKVLLSALSFDLFSRLANGNSMTFSELKSALDWNCTDRHACDYLDALAGFGFLKRDGILETARYSNGPDTEMFLDKAKPSYIGGFLEMLNHRLYGFWGTIEDALRTGEPQNEMKDGGENLFAKIYSSPESLRDFVRAMSGIQMGNFLAFAQQFDFSKYRSLTDVGGSGALLSLMVAKHQPHMACISFDLPPIAPIAQENIDHFHLSDRVKTASGDFFVDDLPAADIIVMGNILHDWDEEKKILLMQKAYSALNPGGVFVAIETIIDAERTHNLFGFLISLTMLIETGHGFDYSVDDFNKWAGIVGFARTSFLPLMGPASAAIAYK